MKEEGMWGIEALIICILLLAVCCFLAFAVPIAKASLKSLDAALGRIDKAVEILEKGYHGVKKEDESDGQQ